MANWPGCWLSRDGRWAITFLLSRILVKGPIALQDSALFALWDTNTSIAQLYDQLGKPDVITIEKEHVNIDLMEGLAEHCLVAPSPDAIRVCQHRGREKTLLQSLGIMTAPFHLVEDASRTDRCGE